MTLKMAISFSLNYRRVNPINTPACSNTPLGFTPSSTRLYQKTVTNSGQHYDMYSINMLMTGAPKNDDHKVTFIPNAHKSISH